MLPDPPEDPPDPAEPPPEQAGVQGGLAAALHMGMEDVLQDGEGSQDTIVSLAALRVEDMEQALLMGGGDTGGYISPQHRSRGSPGASSARPWGSRRGRAATDRWSVVSSGA